MLMYGRDCIIIMIDDGQLFRGAQLATVSFRVKVANLTTPE
jgi:hypothetical protein